MESNNPGGSGKDRAARYMMDAAKADPRFSKGCEIIEGTSGSTGISLALQCKSLGKTLRVVVPDDQSQDKINFLGLDSVIIIAYQLFHSKIEFL